MAAYLITFSCYGWHLPGQEGTIDRNHNTYGSRLRPGRPALEATVRKTLPREPVTLTQTQQDCAARAIADVCRDKHWHLYASHVRTNHIHVVVGSEENPETVMTTLKRYASRALALPATPWARHGSTRHLWSRKDIDRAVKYVLDHQGERMSWTESAR